MKTPEIQVGILSASEIKFRLNGSFVESKGNTIYKDSYSISIVNGRLEWLRENELLSCGKELVFHPQDYSLASFELFDVIIGIDFHWERKENQSFKGSLRFIIEEDKISAINILPIEDYLLSVISSEMSATSSIELLKAHAVISRSWLIAQKEKEARLKNYGEYQSIFETEEEYIRWWDREDHKNFDVCADDHCQRYQGIAKVSTPYAEKAVRETSGEVLVYKGTICDARFSKCCGGITERFENVWEAVTHDYLTERIDNLEKQGIYTLDLTQEDTARQWILGTPEAFCNTNNKQTLRQVLNDYDQETQDFFRWKVSYTQEEVKDLIFRKTGIDFGDILELLPIERGTSGRIVRLKIVGSKKTLTLGKELMIRKTLSESHLYSSAFVVEKIGDGDLPEKFILSGSGWGHGVGLCQIGAAVMGANGYSYQDILKHYFKGAELEKKY